MNDELNSQPAKEIAKTRSKGLNRRNFLAAGAGASAAAIGSTLAAGAQSATPQASPAASPVPALVTPESWDHEVDVVVVGAGSAGHAAAITAQADGADVLIVEKAPNPGGTSVLAYSYWVPNNHLMQKAGLPDPKPDALKYMARLAFPMLYNPEQEFLGLTEHQYSLLEAFYDNAAPAFESFDTLGALKSKISPSYGFSPMPDISDPDYHADLPEDKAPYGRTITGAGDDPQTSHYMAQLQAYVAEKQIPVLTSHAVTGLYRNSTGAVIGVHAESEGGPVAIRARKGVIFTTGGFTQNPEKSLNFLRGPIFGGCGVPTNQGDFIDIGIEAGAKLGNMNNAFWVENVVEAALQNSSTTADVWLPFGDSMIIVNKYGKRVTNEKMVYNERTQVHFEWNAARREYSNLVLFMIWDDAVAQNPVQWPYRFPVPMPDAEMPDYVIKGETWDQLAFAINNRLREISGKRSISAQIAPSLTLAPEFTTSLVETVSTFNSYAEAGKDPEFLRGTTPIQIAWQGPPREGNTKNPTMYPIADKGPYYCVILGGGTLDTKGGPVVDANAQVLALDGAPITGLYGAGNCIASPAGQGYFSAGGTLGPGMTYGYIAGKHVVGQEENPVD
ncbi:MAG: FAD-dependent oxidoreductase [Thermomicrobiales bacterium]